MITAEMLTGRSSAHLVTLCGHHRLQPAAATAFLAMQQAAKTAGLTLQPASSFRDFARQQRIWNEKFRGQRPLLDSKSHLLDHQQLTIAARCEAILHWSALPGASRHHWGSDVDVYDPECLPTGKNLQLEPWEYQEGGYFHALTLWLTQHMADFGFYRPFTDPHHGVAIEPWHLSYRPISQQVEALLTPELLLTAWQGEDIAGSEWLSAHIDDIFVRFIKLPYQPGE